MPGRRSLAERQRFFALLNEGHRKSDAAKLIGINIKTADAWVTDVKNSTGLHYQERKQVMNMSGPIPFGKLKSEAHKARKDFAYFRRRYFGRISSPWQEDAGYKFAEYLESPHREYVVLNCPPGAGKSTIMHDVEAWLTIRNRAIRGLLGSSTQRNAVKYSHRLRRTFERRTPVRGETDQVAAGRAFDAEATLIGDFGRFEPDNTDLWRSEEFVVAQLSDVAIDEKEPTWAAYGLDVDYLGQRVDIAIWDDVATVKSMRTAEAVEKLYGKWDDEAETRIEPGGALFLIGQRLAANDLYRYCINKPAGVVDDEEVVDEPEFDLIEPEGNNYARKYHHIKYPAHFEDLCQHNHKIATAKPWPDGCLLDPVRLPWRELSALSSHRSEKFRVVYQQEDLDPNSVLVPRLWITGGRDPDTGEDFPGCYDKDRALAEVPKGLGGEVLSIVTSDPSPTQFWVTQWWLYHPASEQRFLMDLERTKMDASDFLDWSYNDNRFTGLLESWWERSVKKGKPITHLIVERNAAQRFLLQFDHFKRWQALRQVSLYPHDTTSNKSDDDYGVQTIAPHYRYGRIRLPYRAHGDMGFKISRFLVEEVCQWPDGTTDDCVMAHWFLEWWIPKIVTPDIVLPRKWVPRLLSA